MSKELLKISLVKGTICQAESDFANDAEREMAAASLVSIMDQDKKLAEHIVSYVTLFILKREQMAAANREAIELGRTKTQN